MITNDEVTTNNHVHKIESKPSDDFMESVIRLLRSKRDELSNGLLLNQYWEGYRNALSEVIYLLEEQDGSGINEVMSRNDYDDDSSIPTIVDHNDTSDGISTPLIDLMKWPRFHPFHQKRDKWQSMKLLEEASEVHEAAKRHLKASDRDEESLAQARADMIDEVADLLQTITNFLAAYDVTPEELEQAKEHVTRKNKARGMFEEGPRTHMNRDDE